jgi:hypothetical protein
MNFSLKRRLQLYRMTWTSFSVNMSLKKRRYSYQDGSAMSRKYPDARLKPQYFWR